MFILSLYRDYTHTSKQELIDLLKSEVKKLLGYQYGFFEKNLDRCLAITEEYTDNHQTSTKVKKNAKGEVLRASGEPYFNHLLRTTLILIHEKLFDANILLAALMHDLLEDTDYTAEMMARDFNSIVVDYVKCVTNLTQEELRLAQNKYRGLTADEIENAGIIARCNEHLNAYYIKFADRLDNLMTLDPMHPSFIADKIEETERYFFPILEYFKATNFLKYMKNAIFRQKNKAAYSRIEYRLEKLSAFRSTSFAVKTIKEVFKSKGLTIRLITPTLFEIYTRLRENNKSTSSFAASDILYDIYFIYDCDKKVEDLPSILKKFLCEELLSFTVFQVGKNSFYFIDDVRNRYHVHLLTNDEYDYLKHGKTNRDLIIVSPTNIRDVLAKQVITVSTEDGKPVKLPDGSTVIDFARKVCGANYKKIVEAKINGRSASLDRKLRHDDTVSVLLDEAGPDRAKVEWLMWCHTEETKQNLCDYFGKLLGKAYPELV